MSNFFDENQISRARANSAGSVPDVPYNTPESQSVVNDNASVVSSDVNVMMDGVSQDEKALPRGKNTVTEQTGNERIDLHSPLKNMFRITCLIQGNNYRKLMLIVGDKSHSSQEVKSSSPLRGKG